MVLEDIDKPTPLECNKALCWLERGPFAFLAATLVENETRCVQLVAMNTIKSCTLALMEHIESLTKNL